MSVPDLAPDDEEYDDNVDDAHEDASNATISQNERINSR